MLKKRKLKRLVTSFIMALVVFMGLLTIEKNALSKVPRIKVVKAVRDLEAGTRLNEENVGHYLEMDWLEEDKVPEGTFSDTKELNQYLTRRDIYKNEALTSHNVGKEEEFLHKLENPVEVSVKVNDVSQVVGGVLREGDVVDVAIVNGTTNEHEELLKGVMVVKAIHADGSPITREDKDKSAIIINLLIDKKDEVALNQSINTGMLRLSKILN